MSKVMNIGPVMTDGTEEKSWDREWRWGSNV